MSRIGKQPIVIPDKTTVEVHDDSVTVKGPRGEMTRSFRPSVSILVEGSNVVVAPRTRTRSSQELWGTYASHIQNMITGVNERYEKRLVVEGVGFRAATEGTKLVMQLGFSHPVVVEVPEGLEVEVKDNVISIRGVDKELVGQFAADVRAKKKPEPYKGKGIRYEGEIIRRKQGKRAV